MNANLWDLARAIRGPIMLITFGILMALNHMDKIGFERTWPILIIVYGLLRLAERACRPTGAAGVPVRWIPAFLISARSIHRQQYPPQGGAQ